MLYLMSLEWKKFKLYKYIKSVAIAIIVLIALNCLMVYTSKSENEMMFDSFKTAAMFFNVLVRGVFIIFSSVVLSKLTVDEYKKKTIQLMYSYPISRKKLMMAKLSIVYLFTVITIIIAGVVVVAAMGIFCRVTDSLPDYMTLTFFISELPKIIVEAVLSGFVSLIPFYFGMKKKSTPATIVSSCILAALLTSNMGTAAYYTYGIRLIVVGVISIIIVLATLSRKIDSIQEEEI